MQVQMKIMCIHWQGSLGKVASHVSGNQHMASPGGDLKAVHKLLFSKEGQRSKRLLGAQINYFADDFGLMQDLHTASKLRLCSKASALWRRYIRYCAQSCAIAMGGKVAAGLQSLIVQDLAQRMKEIQAQVSPQGSWQHWQLVWPRLVFTCFFPPRFGAPLSLHTAEQWVALLFIFS